ncbi:hypothetical protein LIER_03457 [Lithospermum erythrorhizon]|uniref:Uncharacterized protein n=1 Tax=Lithospermum erythrorhizon TaxID=34254 RepID=A0AAV3NVY9_LITER
MRLSKDELTTAVTTHIQLEELKVGADKPTDLRETVLKKDGNVSPKKPLVWERIQQDRGQFAGKLYNKGTFPQRGMVRCNQQTSSYEPVNHIPLRFSVAKVFAQVRDKRTLPILGRMRGNSGKRDQNLYCKYHQEQGHDTNDRRILRMEIERLIQRGQLKEFTREKGHERPQGRDASPPRHPPYNRRNSPPRHRPYQRPRSPYRP